MKFSSTEDIEAPIDAVFRAVSNFNTIERSALRRGARVQRVDRKTHPSTRIAWDVGFSFRGKKRDMLIELTEFDEPNRLLAQSLSGGLEGEVMVNLVALSKNRTRMLIDIDLKPKTLSARLMVQSMRLAKTKLTKRYHLKVAGFASGIEDRFKNGKLG
ncbi:SRPBCC family protein [Profundibacter sp.]